jgi:hypothetical protein
MADFPSSRYPSSAESYEYIPQQWSAKIIEAVQSNLVCVGAVNTTWKTEIAKGDKVWIPVGSGLTSGHVDVTADMGGNMNTNFGAAAVYITIDKWDECPVQIDDGTKAQTQVTDLVAVLGKRAGYELAKAIDTDVNSMFYGGGTGLTGTWAGSDGQTFGDDLLIALMEGLDEADVPRTDRSLIVDPSCLADMYKIDKFVHKDYNQTLTGEIGRTPYGDTILITNNLTAVGGTGNYGALIHKDAIGLALQQTPTIENFRWALRHSDVINVSAIWGCDVLRPTFGNYFFTRKA